MVWFSPLKVHLAHIYECVSGGIFSILTILIFLHARSEYSPRINLETSALAFGGMLMAASGIAVSIELSITGIHFLKLHPKIWNKCVKGKMQHYADMKTLETEPNHI